MTFTAAATDLVDGLLPAVCDHDSGDTFPLGDTIVTCMATDAHSNAGTGSFRITVQDTTAPVLVLPLDILAEATGPDGAVVLYSAGSDDLVDGPMAAACSPGSGETFSIGTTSVGCSATDAHGNTSSGSFDVTVQDTTAPTLTLPGDITVEATGPAGAAVTFGASASRRGRRLGHAGLRRDLRGDVPARSHDRDVLRDRRARQHQRRVVRRHGAGHDGTDADAPGRHHGRGHGTGRRGRDVRREREPTRSTARSRPTATRPPGRRSRSVSRP